MVAATEPGGPPAPQSVSRLALPPEAAQVALREEEEEDEVLEEGGGVVVEKEEAQPSIAPEAAQVALREEKEEEEKEEGAGEKGKGKEELAEKVEEEEDGGAEETRTEGNTPSEPAVTAPASGEGGDGAAASMAVAMLPETQVANVASRYVRPLLGSVPDSRLMTVSGWAIFTCVSGNQNAGRCILASEDFARCIACTSTRLRLADDRFLMILTLERSQGPRSKRLIFVRVFGSTALARGGRIRSRSRRRRWRRRRPFSGVFFYLPALLSSSLFES